MDYYPQKYPDQNYRCTETDSYYSNPTTSTYYSNSSRTTTNGYCTPAELEQQSLIINHNQLNYDLISSTNGTLRKESKIDSNLDSKLKAMTEDLAMFECSGTGADDVGGSEVIIFTKK